MIGADMFISTSIICIPYCTEGLTCVNGIFVHSKHQIFLRSVKSWRNYNEQAKQKTNKSGHHSKPQTEAIDPPTIRQKSTPKSFCLLVPDGSENVLPLPADYE